MGSKRSISWTKNSLRPCRSGFTTITFPLLLESTSTRVRVRAMKESGRAASDTAMALWNGRMEQSMRANGVLVTPGGEVSSRIQREKCTMANGATIRLMATAFTYTQTEQGMKDIGAATSKTATGKRLGQMVRSLRALTRTARRTALVSTHGQTEHATRVSGKRMKLLGTAITSGLMGVATSGTGDQTSWMTLGFTHGPTVACTKASTRRIRSMDSEPTHGQIGNAMPAGGVMASSTGSEYLSRGKDVGD